VCLVVCPDSKHPRSLAASGSVRPPLDECDAHRAVRLTNITNRFTVAD
jgi:hypothetical protein